MAAQTFEAGKIIHETSDPMATLELITAGKVTAVYPGGTYELGKGDVIGICEICNEVHFLQYRAAEDVSVASYPVSSEGLLEQLIRQNPDASRFFLRSCFRQITYLLGQCQVSELRCSELYQRLFRDEENYRYLCDRYRVKAKEIEGIDEVSSYLVEEAPDLWLSDYYAGLDRAYGSATGKGLAAESAISMGMLRKGSLDCRKAYQILEEHHGYRNQMAGIYFAKDGNDLFEAMTSLYYSMDKGSEDAKALETDIRNAMENYGGILNLNAPVYAERLSAFEASAGGAKSEAVDGKPETAETDTNVTNELKGSLNTILEFAGADSECAMAFRKHLAAYKGLADPDSSEDAAIKTRRLLAQDFTELYKQIFFRTTEEDEVPLPVWMFLYFGYADEELAGAENLPYLASLARTLRERRGASSGVYPFYDWLVAIYEGRKDPSRDEFEADFTDYLNKQKAAGNITAEELKEFLRDSEARASYELDHLFPQVNKVTFGRITTYCPVFTAANVLKSLEASYVSPEATAKIFQQIRSIDYSAFCRESLDTANMQTMGKETIHPEVLPDVILMPNVGIRGVMWQEIEGKVRVSPGRMVVSIFHLEDLQTTLIRLTGDLRWELCKRIQGARWNDVSERSLTSEYFDYIQFYRKNRDLSADAKEKIRVSLQRAKNSFKEMFVRDYLIWVLFEGMGSPRLNKVAREILFRYCPFRAEVCRKLESNPLYSDLLQRREVKSSQRLHTLDNLRRKIESSGAEVPETLLEEILYTKGEL